MKQLIILLLVFLQTSSFAQQKPASPSGRGATPIQSEKQNGGRGNTYALVVGISDYQDPGIPDLRFADKDAEEFANFLRSPAGGSLDGDHLRLLTNERATAAQVSIALDALVEQVREDDLVIIYFSGHGDVESRRVSQPGYLLAWDAPSRVYMAGGAINVRDMQDIVSTLSTLNKARVVVITDACHAGKLSGNDINGAQLTGQNLARQFANEIKILSCQPNEYSIEGEQWGGGRGAFSYNLVEALYGMADVNSDLSVTLKEVSRYLEDHVSAEVSPVPQNPQVIGNPSELLATVNAKLLADLRSGKTNQMMMLSAIESRGMEDDVLASVDTATRELYRLFKKSLKDKVFLALATAPIGSGQACADAYYERLIAEPKLARLHSTMTRNYAAALQDDAQQVLNTMLKTGLTERVLLSTKATKLYGQYPYYLGRAAQLLGEGHYMYAAMQARKYFFKGQIASKDLERQEAYHQALKWQPDMPHAMAELVETCKSTQADSAYYYFSKATAQVPTWVVPYLRLAEFYQDKAKSPSKADEMLNRVGLLDSTSVLVWYSKGGFYDKQKNWKAAEYWYKKAIEGAGTEICFPCAWNNLGFVYQNTRHYAEAEDAFKKAILLDSTLVNAWNNLGNVYFKTRRYAEAEAACNKAILLDSTLVSAWSNLGNVYLNTRRYAEAEVAYKKAILVDSTFVLAWGNLGNFYLNTRRYDEAEVVFKKAILLDSIWVDAFNDLGNAYINSRRYDEAATAFKKAILLDPTHIFAWYNLGNVYAFTHRYAEAEAAYKKAILLDSTSLNSWTNLGSVYNDTRRYVEAEAVFKKVILLDSTFVYAWYNLTYLYSIQNKYDKAFAALEQTLKKGFEDYLTVQQDAELAPLREQKERWNNTLRKGLVSDSTDSKAWLNFGSYYIQNQLYNDAEPILKKALALDFSLAPAHYLLGKAFFKTNRPADALLEFLKTIELSPQARMARLGMAWLSLAEGKTTEALDWVAQAIEKGGAPFDVLQNDEDLAPLRALPEWKELMKKYFPDQFKD